MRLVIHINSLKMPTDINTISAWTFLISTLVTALTGFFIVQTFQLQAKVAAEQSKITKLEVEKAIMEKRPLFFAEMVENEIGRTDYNFEYGKYELKLIRNDIYSLKINPKFSEEFSNLNPILLHELGEFPNGMIENTIMHFYYKVDKTILMEYENITREEHRELSLTFELEYRDAIGNEYIQEIVTGHGYLPYNKPPKSPSLEEAFKRLRV